MTQVGVAPVTIVMLIQNVKERKIDRKGKKPVRGKIRSTSNRISLGLLEANLNLTVLNKVRLSRVLGGEVEGGAATRGGSKITTLRTMEYLEEALMTVKRVLV